MVATKTTAIPNPADTMIFKLLLDNVKAIGGCILCACELEVPEASA
jgi:hypothetical protein